MTRNTRSRHRWHNLAPRRQVGQRPLNHRTNPLPFAGVADDRTDAELFGCEAML